MPRSTPRSVELPTSPPLAPASRRWLLLVHQLPSTPSNLRVRTWRRLQQLGALVVKQSVYALPDTPAAREDFEWLKTEIESAGGQAVVFSANSVDTWSDDALVEEFRQARQTMYADLAKEIERAIRQADRSSPRKRPATTAGAKQIESFRERFAAIERIDFFGSAGRDRIVTLLDQLERHAAAPRKSLVTATRKGEAETGAYDGRLWVTRPRPGVDRMSSAWLIRRFIDRHATFGFVADAARVPANAVAFDMFGVEFTHRDDQCTFEMLVDTFGLESPSIARIAAIVHDLDLKDARFGAAEASVVGTLIDGLQLAHADDHQLLEQGIALFEALHGSFAQSARLAGPRAVSSRGKKRKS